MTKAIAGFADTTKGQMHDGRTNDFWAFSRVGRGLVDIYLYYEDSFPIRT